MPDSCESDGDGHGLYVDAPWLDAGDDYRHAFTPEQQARLAEMLARLRRARVVVRYGDHPLIRELYPPPRWTWLEQSSRNQRNGVTEEVLLVNNRS